MTAEPPPQLSHLEVRQLDSAAVEQARRDGQLAELLAGRDPGTCPTCGRPNVETGPA